MGIGGMVTKLGYILCNIIIVFGLVMMGIPFEVLYMAIQVIAQISSGSGRTRTRHEKVGLHL
jgi:uncharacterized membrane protein YccF (DUF307 family)